ncbi:integrase/recombinase xerD homolog [Amphiura filiformis]|uniref:integrase/recombinase xerD homolog n=1 Tax=Amphiura filiformis TaxID=82378 RepID=UPI003B21F85B
MFQRFRMDFGLGSDWPASVREVVTFISNESLSGKAPATISSYVAGVSYYHKLGGWQDPTKAFIVAKLLEGCKRLNNRTDPRLPVTLAVLRNIFPVLSSTCSSSYEKLLFQAAFSLAFLDFFLASAEFAAMSRSASAESVSIKRHFLHGDFSALQVRLRFSKTDQRGNATVLTIRNAGEASVCPVSAMVRFLRVRPTGEGPLFVHLDKSPLTRYQVNHILRKALEFGGYPSHKFSSHSFRIGAATSAAVSGFSSEEIQSLGRWRSGIYKVYVRPGAMFTGSQI